MAMVRTRSWAVLDRQPLADLIPILRDRLFAFALQTKGGKPFRPTVVCRARKPWSTPTLGSQAHEGIAVLSFLCLGSHRLGLDVSIRRAGRLLALYHR